MCRAPLRSLILGGLTAFFGAGLAGFAAGFAFGNLGALLALFLAVRADHLDCSELTAASAASALQAATSWKAVSAQPAMLVSFILFYIVLPLFRNFP
jgi:hypothetical protein